MFGGLVGDLDRGTLASTPHHQSLLTLVQRVDGLTVPVLARPELTHVQKFIYPDKEKDLPQLEMVRPYRYFAALINAYPDLQTFNTIGTLVLEGLKCLNRVPANELIDVSFLLRDLEGPSIPAVASFCDVPDICRKLYGDLWGVTQFEADIREVSSQFQKLLSHLIAP